MCSSLRTKKTLMFVVKISDCEWNFNSSMQNEDFHGEAHDSKGCSA